MSKRRRATIAAAVGLLLCCGLVLAQSRGSPREDAQRLADEALAMGKKGDKLETGWEAVYDSGIGLAEQAIARDPSVADVKIQARVGFPAGGESSRGTPWV